VFLLAAMLIVPMWASRFAGIVSAQHAKMTGQPASSQQHANMTMTTASGQRMKHGDRKHMHVKNWALEPTGISGVFPLDPNTIPKFRNDLIRMPVFVPVGTKREPSTGRNLPLYEVTESAFQIPLLPPGFPTTLCYVYGGKVNLAGPGQPQNIVTAFSMPGPTFETQRDRRIFVHYINNLDGPHQFPVDPTIMA